MNNMIITKNYFNNLNLFYSLDLRLILKFEFFDFDFIDNLFILI